MRFYLLILVFICSTFLLSAQESSTYFGNESFFGDSAAIAKADKSPLKTQNRLNVRFTTGMMYSSNYGNGLFSAYAAPEVNYKLTNRFSVSGGFMMTTTSVPSIMFNESGQSSFMENKMLSYYMFARGEYMITDKLRVKATTAFDVSPGQNSNRLAFGSIGFDYKVGKDSFISAEFIINNTSNYNPMYHQTPFGAYDNRSIRPHSGSMFSDTYTAW
jgi:hypothetical protein